MRCGDEDMVHCGARLPVPSYRGGVLASSLDPARAHLPLNHNIKVLALRQATPFQRARHAMRAILACSAGELGVQSTALSLPRPNELHAILSIHVQSTANWSMRCSLVDGFLLSYFCYVDEFLYLKNDCTV